MLGGQAAPGASVHRVIMKAVDYEPKRVTARVGDTIEWRATVNDPAILSEPWQLKPQVMWITDIEIEEPARCEDRDVEHIIDGSHHDNPR